MRAPIPGKNPHLRKQRRRERLIPHFSSYEYQTDNIRAKGGSPGDKWQEPAGSASRLSRNDTLNIKKLNRK